MNLIVAGRTFTLRDRRMGEHLWFVLTNPEPVTSQVVIVALVSEKAHTDKTVHLMPGDHPFVRWASNIDYGSATFKPAGKIEAWLATGRATLDSDTPDDTLLRIRAGLLASSRTPNVVAAYCAKHFLQQ